MKADDIQNPSQYSAEKNEQFATVRIVGNLARSSSGKRQDTLKIDVPVKVGSLLEALSRLHGLTLPRESTLVLVNGVEANALEDLDTIIQAGDQVFLVPMIHGG
jgi:molybdopterin converting factor small subunit